MKKIKIKFKNKDKTLTGIYVLRICVNEKELIKSLSNEYKVGWEIESVEELE